MGSSRIFSSRFKPHSMPKYVLFYNIQTANYHNFCMCGEITKKTFDMKLYTVYSVWRMTVVVGPTT